MNKFFLILYSNLLIFSFLNADEKQIYYKQAVREKVKEANQSNRPKLFEVYEFGNHKRLSEELRKVILNTAPKRVISHLQRLKDQNCPSQISPRALILHGPSGSGKTVLAQAMAEELGGNLIFIKGPLVDQTDKEFELSQFKKMIKDAQDAPGLTCIVIDGVDLYLKFLSKCLDFSEIDKALESLVLSNKAVIIGVHLHTGIPAEDQFRIYKNSIFTKLLHVPLLESVDNIREVVKYHLSKANSKADYNTINNFVNELKKMSQKLSHFEIRNIISRAMDSAYHRTNSINEITKTDFMNAIAETKTINERWESYRNSR
jgi:SpoVK/Ycf46/Vps4 family AAA+-type ATPase